MGDVTCRHRLVPDRESYCWNALVAEGEQVLCDDAKARVCARREAMPLATRRAVPCPCCGRGHFEGSGAQMICHEWHSAKLALKRMRAELPGVGYYAGGTREPASSQDAPAFVRSVVLERTKAAVLRRDKWTCQDCGASFGGKRRRVYDAALRRGRGGYRVESLEVHHIIPRAEGGSDHPGNLKTLCPECHMRYTTEHAAARAVRKRERRSALSMLEADDPEEGYDPRD